MRDCTIALKRNDTIWTISVFVDTQQNITGFTISETLDILFLLMKQYWQRWRFSVNWTMWSSSFKGCVNLTVSWCSSAVPFQFLQFFTNKRWPMSKFFEISFLPLFQFSVTALFLSNNPYPIQWVISQFFSGAMAK